MKPTKPSEMLKEYDVIEAVCAYLQTRCYEIKQMLKTTQTGDDIIATKQDSSGVVRYLHIEAKGATSSRQASARFGKPFNSAQVRAHVSEAFYKSAEVLSRPLSGGLEMRAGMALPDTTFHRRYVENIAKTLAMLDIAFFWVYADCDVEIVSPWEI